MILFSIFVCYCRFWPPSTVVWPAFYNTFLEYSAYLRSFQMFTNLQYPSKETESCARLQNVLLGSNYNTASGGRSISAVWRIKRIVWSFAQIVQFPNQVADARGNRMFTIIAVGKHVISGPWFRNLCVCFMLRRVKEVEDGWNQRQFSVSVSSSHSRN